DSLQRQTALAADPPAAGPPATQRGHVGLDPGFINEHQPCAGRGWTASAASAAAGGRCQRVPARERTVFFFEPEPFAAQKPPHRVVRDLHPARRQLILQLVECELWCLVDPLDDECPVWLPHKFAVPAHLRRRN